MTDNFLLTYTSFSAVHSAILHSKVTIKCLQKEKLLAAILNLEGISAETLAFYSQHNGSVRYTMAYLRSYCDVTMAYLRSYCDVTIKYHILTR